MNFTFTPLDLPGVVRIDAQAFEDDRGLFMERYKQSSFAENGIADVFCQDNLSRSERGVLRGLHYQLPPFDQAKLVSVVDGAIWDVAVDIRRGSSTFGRWVAQELSARNRRSLYVPAGFAHGFLVTSDHAVVTYKTSREYARSYERGIRWDDAELAIDWPLDAVGPAAPDATRGTHASAAARGLKATAAAERAPRLSEKDAALPTLADADLPAVKEGHA